MLKFFAAFFVGIGLLGAVAAGPLVFRSTRISSLQAASVRVESIPQPRPRSSTVIIGGSSSSGSSSSGRYSSGGGFSSGK